MALTRFQKAINSFVGGDVCTHVPDPKRTMRLMFKGKLSEPACGFLVVPGRHYDVELEGECHLGMAFRIYEPNSLASAFCPYESVQAFWANWEFVDESQPPAGIMPFRNTGHHGVSQLSGNESSR